MKYSIYNINITLNMPPKAKKSKDEEEDEVDDLEEEQSEEEEDEEVEEVEIEQSESDEDIMSVASNSESEDEEEEDEKKTVTSYKSDTLFEYKNNMMKHKHKSQTQYNIQTVVPSNERITSNLLQQTEFSRVIGLRIQQLEAGDPPRIPNTKGMNLSEIAIQELLSKKISFVICRHVNINEVEKWSTSEMNIDTTRFCTIGPANDKIKSSF